MSRWEWYTPRNGKWITTNEEAARHMMEFRGGLSRPDLYTDEGATVDELRGLRIRRRGGSPAPAPRDEPGSILDLFRGQDE